jgi:hypothetical protein
MHITACYNQKVLQLDIILSMGPSNWLAVINILNAREYVQKLYKHKHR